MKPELAAFLAEHTSLTRRYFLRCGTAGVAAMSALPMLARGAERDAALQKVVDDLETWLTKQDDFQNVSRGNPKPYSLDEAKRKEVGLTRDTWKLEVVDDPDNSARLRNPMTKEKNTALDFAAETTRPWALRAVTPPMARARCLMPVTATARAWPATRPSVRPAGTRATMPARPRTRAMASALAR